MESYAAGPCCAGAVMRHAIPVPDGDYQVRLLFAEPNLNDPNRRRFDVTLQGQPVLTDYNIFTAAGGVRVAVAESFSATAAGDAGIVLEIINFSDWRTAYIATGLIGLGVWALMAVRSGMFVGETSETPKAAGIGGGTDKQGLRLLMTGSITPIQRPAVKRRSVLGWPCNRGC